jgi:DNA-directed RNA polymerase specialized sigma24 family protein
MKRGNRPPVPLKLIKNVCFSVVKNSGYDVEELYSEALVIYAEKRNLYDRSKSTKFTTFIYVVLHNALIDWSQKNNKYKQMYINTDFSSSEEFSNKNEFRNQEDPSFNIENPVSVLDHLSDSGKKIAELLFTNWAELSELKPKFIRGEISRMCIGNGWKFSQFWNDVKEIKQLLS